MFSDIIKEFEEEITELQNNLEPEQTFYKIRVKKLIKTLNKLIELQAQLNRADYYKHAPMT